MPMVRIIESLKDMKSYLLSAVFADYFELSEKYDQVGNVRFSPDIESSMLVITTFNGVVFGHWVNVQKLQLKIFFFTL